jgi:hypothetical protein
MPKVPSYSKIYNRLIERGTDPVVANAQAKALIYYYNKQYRDEGETESDEEDEDDPRSIISRDLGKMKLYLAQLLNKYKQDKTLPKVIKYLAEMQNKT